MRWFKQAAERGHPHASYNLAVGHLKGLPSDLKPGEARKYLHRAAAKGIIQAHDMLNDACAEHGAVIESRVALWRESNTDDMNHGHTIVANSRPDPVGLIIEPGLDDTRKSQARLHILVHG
uniref:Sel1 repeat family protein n=1 Tax=Macrostomum lignano TaxID=282301 RepID=A0A1I8FBN2_9PLAT